MAIIMRDISAVNCTVGIQAPSDSDIQMETVHLENVSEQGILITPARSLLEQLGLPPNTDPVLLAEVLSALQKISSTDKEAAVRRSGLFEKVGRTAMDISTFASNIVTISGQPAIADIIKKLTGGTSY